MYSSIAGVVAIVAATYVFPRDSSFLTQKPRDLMAVVSIMPFVNTLFVMLTKTNLYYLYMRHEGVFLCFLGWDVHKTPDSIS